MPTPKLFKKLSSKSNSSESGTTPGVPADGEKVDFSRAVSVNADSPVPEYPESLKEAWAAAHKELPQTKGVEKFLNNIGTLVIPSSVHISPPRSDR